MILIAPMLNALHQAPFHGLGFSDIHICADKKILLVKLIKKGKIPSQAGKLSILIKDSQTDGMKRTKVHLIEIEPYIKLI